MVKRFLFTGFDKWFCLNTSLPLHAVFKNHLRTIVPSQTNQNMMNVLNLSGLAWSLPSPVSTSSPRIGVSLEVDLQRPQATFVEEKENQWRTGSLDWSPPGSNCFWGLDLDLGFWQQLEQNDLRNPPSEITKKFGAVFTSIFWQIWYYDKIW